MSSYCFYLFFFFLESFIFSNNNKSYKLHPCHTLALTSVMSVSFPQLRILHCVCLYFACIKFVIFCGIPKWHQFLKENPNSVVKRFFFFWSQIKLCLLQAYSVLGHFLILEKDQIKFKKWLHDNCGANSSQQEDCYNCLKEWCDSFLWSAFSNLPTKENSSSVVLIA